VTGTTTAEERGNDGTRASVQHIGHDPCTANHTWKHSTCASYWHAQGRRSVCTEPRRWVVRTLS
jgi:hypothetical protein